ncbi:TetR/AcrR family transcriptional regulator [Leptonema illini]|uniref:Regulatory protein TetR n=1 Tax=Leptonema illini DSM 21528 TaxID=929563 RepID=H2CGJ9_9LEPT|nr:TetR/AcrR family transcriptional regulator [Leptonema illini]EHQ07916.1 regulatory protein TetR [Leptonema illini DSM 21528]
MRYAEGHKDQTRKKILEVAGKKFRKDGVGAVGLATLMADAGLTNGAFYAHFKSKEDLLKNVVCSIFDESETSLQEIARVNGLESALRAYLSPQHRDNPSQGCPTAALVSEIARHPRATRTIYTKKIEEVLEQLASLLAEKDPATRKQTAIALYSLLVGAVQLARAVTDKELSDEIMDSALAGALSLIG